MNGRLIARTIGLIMIIEGGLLLLPLLVALYYREGDWKYFLYTAVGSALVGLGLFLIPLRRKAIHAREGFVITALTWIVMSLIATVPFVVSGTIPNFLNALFETVSGFTTTGCTIMDDVEHMTNSMLFWRSFTHWIGGMGILVFMLAISPVAGGGTAIYMLRAESPGPTTEKISPKISTTARYLYLIYIIFTVAEFICLVIAKLTPFHSLLVTFGTVATGGFSYMNTSLAALTSAQQIIVTVFMVMCGVNFTLYFLTVTGAIKRAFKDEELHWYLAIYLISIVVIMIGIFPEHYSSFGTALQKTAFSVAAVMTTTGFSVCDMSGWPLFTKSFILFIMFFGASAGSTAGGIKISRIAIGLKNVRNGLKSMIHPRSVTMVRFNKKEVSNEVTGGVMFYIILLVLLTAASLIIVSIDPKSDFLTAFSAVDTTINNNGVAFAGAAGSFSGFAWYSKIVFIIDMLIGRLEIFPILILAGTIFNPVSELRAKIRRRIRY